MKFLVALMMIAFCNVASANYRTQDNENYIVLLKSELTRPQIAKCQRSICRFAERTGTSLCENIADQPGAYIIVANLSANAAERVARFSCVASIEKERIEGPYPSVGRGN